MPQKHTIEYMEVIRDGIYLAIRDEDGAPYDLKLPVGEVEKLIEFLLLQEA